MASYIDNTKTGASSYRALQAANYGLPEPEKTEEEKQREQEETEALRRKLESEHPTLSYAEYVKQNQGAIVERPQVQGSATVWGDSKYDKEYIMGDEIDHLADIRAENQPWYSKVGNALAKTAITAGTTWIDGVIGTPIGIVQACIEGRFSALWDNDITRSMDTISKWSEQFFPNYRTEKEQNDHWWNRMNTINFWYDDIVKNIGFTIGAIYSGAVYTKALQVGMKGVGLLAKLGTSKSAAVNTLVGSVISAVNEGAIEALNNTDDWKDTKLMELEDTYRGAYDKIREEVARELNIEERAEALRRELDRDIAQGLSMDVDGTGRNLALERYKNQMALLQQEFEQALATNEKMQKLEAVKKETATKIEEDSKLMGNRILLYNIPILTWSNALQFTRLYNHGFRSSRILNNVKLNSAEEGITGGVKSITNIPLARAKAVVERPLAEGWEEISQSIGANIAGDYYSTDVNNFYKRSMDPTAEQETLSWINAMAQGITETLTDENTYMEGFAGFLTGALGVPKLRSFKNSRGKWQSPIVMQGGVYEDIKETNERIRREKEVVDYINTRLEDPKFKNYYQGLIRHKSLQTVMDEAIRNGDKFEFKNAEFQQLVSDIIMFDNANQLDGLKELIQLNQDTSDANLEEIIKQTTRVEKDGTLTGPFAKYAVKNNDGTVAAGTLSDEAKKEMSAAIIKNTKTVLDTIDDYQKLKDDIDVETNVALSDEQLKHIIWMRMQMKNWYRRNSELRSHLRDIFFPASEFINSLDQDIDTHIQDQNALQQEVDEYNSKVKFWEKQEKNYVEDNKKIEEETKAIQSEKEALDKEIKDNERVLTQQKRHLDKAKEKLKKLEEAEKKKAEAEEKLKKVQDEVGGFVDRNGSTPADKTDTKLLEEAEAEVVKYDKEVQQNTTRLTERLKKQKEYQDKLAELKERKNELVDQNIQLSHDKQVLNYQSEELSKRKREIEDSYKNLHKRAAQLGLQGMTMAQWKEALAEVRRILSTVSDADSANIDFSTLLAFGAATHKGGIKASIENGMKFAESIKLLNKEQVQALQEFFEDDNHNHEGLAIAYNMLNQIMTRRGLYQAIIKMANDKADAQNVQDNQSSTETEDANTSPLKRETLDTVLRDMVDAIRMELAMRDYNRRLEEYLQDPKLVEEGYFAILDEEREKGRRKIKNAFKKTLAEAKNQAEFRKAFEESNEEWSDEIREEVLQELIKEGNTLTKEFFDRRAYYNRIEEALFKKSDSFIDETSLNALSIFNNLFENTETLKDLQNKDHTLLSDNTFFDKDEDTVEQKAANHKAFNEAVKLLTQVMSTANDDWAKEEQMREQSKTDDNKEKEKKGEEKKDNDLPFDNNDNDKDKEDLATFVPGAEAANDAMKPSTFAGATLEEIDESKDSKEKRSYYRPVIPELYIPTAKDGKIISFPQGANKNSEGINFDTIYNYLKDHGAFTYVNEGNLHEGDMVYFMIDPTFQNARNDQPIFMVVKTKDSNGEDKIQVVGSLDEGSSMDRYLGLSQLSKRVKSEYDEHIKSEEYNKLSDEQKKAMWVSSKEKPVKVTKIMKGIFATGQEQTLEEAFESWKKNSKFDKTKVAFGVQRNGTWTWAKSRDFDIDKVPRPKNPSGCIYMFVPDAAGGYSAIPLKNSFFNKQNSKTEEVKKQIETFVSYELQENQDRFDKTRISSFVESLNKLLYFRDINISYYENTRTHEKYLEVIRFKRDALGKPLKKTKEINGEQQEVMDVDTYSIRLSDTQGELLDEDGITSNIIECFKRYLLWNTSIANLQKWIDNKQGSDWVLEALSTNVTDPVMKGNWFVTEAKDDKGNVQKPVIPQTKFNKDELGNKHLWKGVTYYIKKTNSGWEVHDEEGNQISQSDNKWKSIVTSYWITTLSGKKNERFYTVNNNKYFVGWYNKTNTVSWVWDINNQEFVGDKQKESIETDWRAKTSHPVQTVIYTKDSATQLYNKANDLYKKCKKSTSTKQGITVDIFDKDNYNKLSENDKKQFHTLLGAYLTHKEQLIKLFEGGKDSFEILLLNEMVDKLITGSSPITTEGAMKKLYEDSLTPAKGTTGTTDGGKGAAKQVHDKDEVIQKIQNLQKRVTQKANEEIDGKKAGVYKIKDSNGVEHEATRVHTVLDNEARPNSNFIGNAATEIGTIGDEILRMLVIKPELTYEQYKLSLTREGDPCRITEAAFNNLKKVLLKWNIQGTPINEDVVLFHNFNGTWIAGEVDLITVDNDGKVRIYDFKSFKNSISDEKTPYDKHRSQYANYSMQLELYKKLIEEELNVEVAEIKILGYKVQYDPNSSRDNVILNEVVVDSSKAFKTSTGDEKVDNVINTFVTPQQASATTTKQSSNANTSHKNRLLTKDSTDIHVDMRVAERKWERTKKVYPDARAWIKDVLPMLFENDVMITEAEAIAKGLFTAGSKGEGTWIQLCDALNKLDSMEHGFAERNREVYRKAFSFVFNSMLSEQQKAVYLRDTADVYGKLTRKELEDKLADQFAEYTEIRQTQLKKSNSIVEFFKWLWDLIRNWTDIHPHTLYLFENINNSRIQGSEMAEGENFIKDLQEKYGLDIEPYKEYSISEVIDMMDHISGWLMNGDPRWEHVRKMMLNLIRMPVTMEDVKVRFFPEAVPMVGGNTSFRKSGTVIDIYAGTSEKYADSGFVGRMQDFITTMFHETTHAMMSPLQELYEKDGENLKKTAPEMYQVLKEINDLYHKLSKEISAKDMQQDSALRAALSNVNEFIAYMMNPDVHLKLREGHTEYSFDLMKRAVDAYEQYHFKGLAKLIDHQQSIKNGTAWETLSDEIREMLEKKGWTQKEFQETEEIIREQAIDCAAYI